MFFYKFLGILIFIAVIIIVDQCYSKDNYRNFIWVTSLIIVILPDFIF